MRNAHIILRCNLQSSAGATCHSHASFSQGATCPAISSRCCCVVVVPRLVCASLCKLLLAVTPVHVLLYGPSSPPLRLASTFWCREHGNGSQEGNGCSISAILATTITTTTMAAQRYCPSCLTSASPTSLLRTTPRAIAPPSFLRPFHTSSPLAAVQSANAQKYKRKDVNNQVLANKKKKKTSTSYATPDLRDALQFSLVDAMRYVDTRRAFFSQPTQHLTLQSPLATCVPPK